ncbi:hypothetical protein OH492_27675 [Vibrio chagasii]|nr:hypothetical protein [Vibrio chagasii]
MGNVLSIRFSPELGVTIVAIAIAIAIVRISIPVTIDRRVMVKDLALKGREQSALHRVNELLGARSSILVRAFLNGEA